MQNSSTYTQPPLISTDPIVQALISPTTCVTSMVPGSLWSVEIEATIEQLETALTVMSDEVRRGREPVLLARLRRLREGAAVPGRVSVP